MRAEPHDTVRHLAEYVSMDAELGFIRDHHDVIHFSDALRLVGAPDDEPDLAPAHERALGEWALEKHGSDVLAVEGYPMAKRPFYSHPQPDDPRWWNSFDLLFRGLELVTGGQRLHRLSDYLAAPEGPASPHALTAADGADEGAAGPAGMLREAGVNRGGASGHTGS